MQKSIIDIFKRTIIKNNVMKNKSRRLTAVCKNWGFGLDFTHCFVLLWSVIY